MDWNLIAANRVASYRFSTQLSAPTTNGGIVSQVIERIQLSDEPASWTPTQTSELWFGWYLAQFTGRGLQHLPSHIERFRQDVLDL